MKKIGFKIPNKSHSFRGVGFYSNRLLTSMLEIAGPHNLEIIPFSDERANSFDLVHIPHFDLFKHSLPINRRHKTVVSVLDVIPLESPAHYPRGIKGEINLYLQKMALSSADRVITISTYSKKQIQRYLSVKPDKISVTVLAADKDFKPMSENAKKKIKLKYKLPDKFILYVGDINWNKNVLNLIKACELLKIHLVIVGKQAKEISILIKNTPSGPRDIYRKLTGSPHPELSHLREVSEYLAHDQIITLGFVPTEDLVGIYNLATVYCQPSLLEGFGLPLLEAMACGTPSVSSNRSCLPEVGGDAVLYFEPEEVEQIANTIRMVLGSAKVAKGLSKKGLKQSRFFSWNQTAALTVDTYLGLI